MHSLLSATFIAVAVIMTASAQTSPPNPCAQWSSSCQVCLSHPDCGWCSEDVVYPGNITGTRCAGVESSGRSKFKCNGLYSVGQCQAGYTCNKTAFTCSLAAPGHGTTKDDCEAECYNKGQVYLCNHTSKKCHPVSAGTPGASSLGVCEASCIHPSAHPSSAHPSPPAATYTCNKANGTCEQAKPGHGASKEVCEQTCTNSSNTQYYCDVATHTCMPTTPGQPGEKKDLCEATCKEHVNPGPPAQFSGLWRGIAIQNGYKVGEWDMEFTQTTATIIDVYNAVTIKGTPYNVINGDDIDLWVKITSGPGVGQTIKAIGKTDSRGPETDFLTAAFGAAGGATPTSLATAMTTAGQKVFFLSKCAGTPECLFVLPNGMLLEERLQEVIAMGLTGAEGSMVLDNHRVDTTTAKKSLLRTQQEDVADVSGQAGADYCRMFNASCTECTSHHLCGWCSQDVEYKDGQTGTQCAGFNPDPHATQNFTCKGQFSTYGCDTGYKCNTVNYTCEIDPIPGNGHTKEVCEALCRPTPAPTKVKEYVCNITTKQCHPCKEEFCPGAEPKEGCEASCIKPHKGPSKDVAGMWRGIQINEHYALGEYDLVLNASKVALYKNSKQVWSGTVESYGGDVMIFEISGKKLPAIYSVADQTGGFYKIMTMAFGLSDGAIPQGFAPPMETKGMMEFVMAQCTSAPCEFKFPSP